MKVTYNWLKDFVEIKISPPALADKLTMAGLEVTSWEQKGGDFIFELEITSNRPDCLSVIGIAREVAAITGKKLTSWPVSQLASLNRQTGKQANRLRISLQNKQDCPLYTAKIIKDVKVGPSPEWLKKRLELVGCRSVNNIVDITNYVLFELGEPLHAFDLDRLVSPLEIIIRRAKKGEEIITIDSVRRILGEEVLVIASGTDEQTGKQANRQTGKPIAIAGVMGGKDTEVSENTKNILLEAAIFNPLILRRSRQKLGIQSEASYRFERGIDPQIVEIASQRAAELIRKIAGGTFVLAKNAGLVKSGAKKIDLDIDRVNKNLGINITATDIKRILSGLGFRLHSESKKIFNVDIPSYRQDVKAQIDLIEEIARIVGYENIPRTLPSVSLQTQAKEITSLIPRIKNILFGLGLNEVITYSLVDREALKGFWDREDNLIEIANPLSQEQGVLRPLLMPSLAKCIAYNLRQQQPHINVFEIAKIYSLDNNKIREKYSLGIALCGTKSRWFGPTEKHVQDGQGFYHLKGILDVLFERLGIREKSGYRFMANGEVEVYIGNAKAGILKDLQEEILDRLDVKYKKIFEAEIALEENLFPFIQTDKKFDVNKVARYPAIIRDVTLQLKEGIPLKDILIATSQTGENLLVFTEFVTYYKGERVPAGFKRITISCKYRSENRTLTEEEIAPIHDRLVKILQEKFRAEIC